MFVELAFPRVIAFAVELASLFHLVVAFAVELVCASLFVLLMSFDACYQTSMRCGVCVCVCVCVRVSWLKLFELKIVLCICCA